MVGWSQWILFEPIGVVPSNTFCCVFIRNESTVIANWVWITNNCPSYLISPNYIAFSLHTLGNQHSDGCKLGKFSMKLIGSATFLLEKKVIRFFAFLQQTDRFERVKCLHESKN